HGPQDPRRKDVAVPRLHGKFLMPAPAYQDEARLRSCIDTVSRYSMEGSLEREVTMNRRQFLKDASAMGGAALLAPKILRSFEAGPAAPGVARVAFVKTTDRASGVARAIDLLSVERFSGKDLFLKPNFNSADSPPGSTHQDALAALVRKLKAMG